MNTKINLGVIIMIALVISTIGSLASQYKAEGQMNLAARREKAPVATFENDIYVAWWTNETGNDEVMYRMSGDGGKTFTDKINLSNTPGTDSADVEIAADEGKVAITWWERSETVNEPVIRLSSDGGKNFGPVLKLANNGTIGG
jgi:hypothetical protein